VSFCYQIIENTKVKLPADNVVIPQSKLIAYLVVFKPKNDKSKFLAQAGFYTDNTQELERAIRQLLRDYDAIIDRQDEYGTFYRVEGLLHGSTGILNAVTIWLWQEANDKYRFITLKPSR
jgi:hypothetical protein